MVLFCFFQGSKYYLLRVRDFWMYGDISMLIQLGDFMGHSMKPIFNTKYMFIASSFNQPPTNRQKVTTNPQKQIPKISQLHITSSTSSIIHISSTETCIDAVGSSLVLSSCLATFKPRRRRTEVWRWRCDHLVVQEDDTGYIPPLKKKTRFERESEKHPT